MSSFDSYDENVVKNLFFDVNDSENTENNRIDTQISHTLQEKKSYNKNNFWSKFQYVISNVQIKRYNKIHISN